MILPCCLESPRRSLRAADMSDADHHLSSYLEIPVLFSLLLFGSPRILSDDENGLSYSLLSIGGNMWESDWEVSCIG
jgi:hypothetical protein